MRSYQARHFPPVQLTHFGDFQHALVNSMPELGGGVTLGTALTTYCMLQLVSSRPGSNSHCRPITASLCKRAHARVFPPWPSYVLRDSQRLPLLSMMPGKRTPGVEQEQSLRVRSGYSVRRFLYGQIYQLAGKPICVLCHVADGTTIAPTGGIKLRLQIGFQRSCALDRAMLSRLS